MFAHVVLISNAFLRYNRSNKAEQAVSACDWENIQSFVERALEARGSAAEEIEREQIRDRLIDSLRPLIARMVRTLVADAHLVDDITQEVLLHLSEKLPYYNPKLAPFRSWASRVVINFTYNALLRYQRPRRYEVRESDCTQADPLEEPLSVLEQTADWAPDPSEQASERERLELILACAQQTLSADEYLVWLEQVVNGSSYQEIALLLDRNENWARQTLLRARQKLAAAIILHPKIVSDEEIRRAIQRCQRSEEPLSEAEIQVLQEVLPANGERRTPGWRQINLFRQACYKLLPFLLGCLPLALGSF
ncbi:MAG: sigma-70 family RNA polymerase sigma factor [Fimbriimonadales bacterium]|nr:sigma-70 family RNA polymerase sigma factor [Fimbriimonadales bacterium]